MESLHTYKPVCKDYFGEFETALAEKHRLMMRKEMKAEIQRCDRLLFDEARRTCPVCGARMHAHGMTGEKSVLAACGEVRIRLCRLRCTACGHIAIPGAVLIPKNGISAPLAERMCDLASRMPYGKAADSLFIQQGVRMSVKRFWGCVQKEAALIEDVLKAEATELFESGAIPAHIDLEKGKPLVIGIDGGHVRGWGDDPAFEVKCATIATGSLPGPGKHRHLKDRVGYAALCSVDEFRKRISVLAIKCGSLSASAVIFVSDGAWWISKMIADYFPDAVHVLDMYHLKHQIEALYGIRAQGIEADIRDAALDACNTSDPDLIAEIIRTFGPRDASKAEQAAKLVAYIESNAQAIRNHRFVSIHGSGWIEKGVDLMISRRMKNRGMSWTKAGSSHIIPFAVMRYNKQWDVYWNQRKGLDRVYAA